MATMTLTHWTDGQIRDFVREVRKEWGALWDNVGPAVRLALIEQKVFKIYLIQAAKIEKAAVIELRAAMMAAVGIED